MLRLAAARRIAVGRSRSDEAPAQPLNRARRRDSAANLRTRGNEHPITGWLIGAAALGARAGPGLLGAAGGAASPTPAGHEFMPANKKRRKYPRYTRPGQGGGGSGYLVGRFLHPGQFARLARCSRAEPTL